MNGRRKKGCIGGIQKFSTEDGPGIRTTLFFKGCPINCKWCHNPDLISCRPEILYIPGNCIRCGACLNACPNSAIFAEENGISIDRDICNHCGICAESCYTNSLRVSGKYMELQDVMDALTADKSFFDKTGGGVTLSGGEVTFQADYAYEIEQECIKRHIGVAIDTCGYTPYGNLEKLAADAQYILYDIKCIDSETHKAFTGAENELILENLKKLADDPALKEKVIVRMPLVHPVNDKLEYMEKTCALLKELDLKTVHGIPYHSLGSEKSRSMGAVPVIFETPSDIHLNAVRRIFEENGIAFSVMGRDE